MNRFILFSCFLSVPIIVAAIPKMEGPPSYTVIIHDASKEEAGAPAPPPADYLFVDHPQPPIPEKPGSDHIEDPSTLLTSAQISERFADFRFPPEEHGKTIDEIILENTEDLNSSSVREGDIRISERKRRSTEEDFVYDYGATDAPEAPGLPVDEIQKLPPIDKVAPEGRSNEDTIDKLLKDIGQKEGGFGIEQAHPKAPGLLMGQAQKRANFAVDELVDMDMLLTPDQQRELYERGSGRKKRAAIKATLWPQGVLPYTMASNAFSEKDKTVIYGAMNEWQQTTCVRFEPFTEQLATKLKHKNRIHIQNGRGCSSYVGVIHRGPQPVTLAGGCRIKSIVLHELGHAIGLHHEQCRPDRDQFVRINENNVYRSMLYNFDKYSTRQIDYRGYKYDYYSIMHYGKTAFSKDGSITIQPVDRTMDNVIGNQRKLSASDSGVVKKMYKCSGITTKPTTTRAPITDCVDKGQYCGYWKDMGQCEKNPGWMWRQCTKTCNKCKGGNCKDNNKYCKDWTAAGYCGGAYADYMTKNCAKSCGTCGTAFKDMADLWGTAMPVDEPKGAPIGAIVGGVIAAIVIIAIVAILLKKKLG